MQKLPSSNIYCSYYGTSNQNRQLYIHTDIYANGATVTQHQSNIAHNHPNSGISCGTNTNISFPVSSKHSFRKPGLEITHRSKNYTINEYLDVCTWKVIYALFQRYFKYLSQMRSRTEMVFKIENWHWGSKTQRHKMHFLKWFCWFFALEVMLHHAGARIAKRKMKIKFNGWREINVAKEEIIRIWQFKNRH